MPAPRLTAILAETPRVDQSGCVAASGSPDAKDESSSSGIAIAALSASMIPSVAGATRHGARSSSCQMSRSPTSTTPGSAIAKSPASPSPIASRKRRTPCCALLTSTDSPRAMNTASRSS
jgi:hypothetical protein